ncbi:MAG: efflux RND transporter permease subunit [Kofleriaceae bacterium]|nr:efflux RND transporter permease subunit [Kofleriaceae bacterium]MCB9573414.1 efflux RND transporter permease subunit [Kofleriaceae bacterium]
MSEPGDIPEAKVVKAPSPDPDRGPRTLGGKTGEDVTKKGAFAWFARNPVAANILILVIIAGGLLSLLSIRQEVFPEVELDIIVIDVAYPGASPEEVEKGVTLVTEEAVRGIDGVKQVTSTSSENHAAIVVELQLGTNTDEALNKVRAAVDRITTFPEAAEKPNIFEATNRFQTLSLVLYGDQPPEVLKVWAERMRDDLLQLGDITTVEVSGLPAPEISIEIPEDTLRRYHLTLEQVALIIKAASVETPAGQIKTAGGEILLRTTERRETAEELASITVLSQPDGTEVKLGAIATITDGFADTDQTAYFDGQRAVMINVFRVGDEKPLDVAKAARGYLHHARSILPEGLHTSVWFDTSELYAQRVDLLKHNAMQGLVLVIILLGLFLELRLAFWVTIGIPVSFLGSMLLLPQADVSINMISLFAFILTLGMVVDDAINVGEAVQRYREEGHNRLEAAILGLREVVVPVIFAVGTTMVAYAPMLFVPGVAGKFFRNVPIVVISVLAFSLFESMFVLPAHLAHSKESKGGILRWIDHRQAFFRHGLDWFVRRVYAPMLRLTTRRRYLTLAIALSVLMTTCGVVGGGHIKFTFMPEIEADQVTFEAHLPFGTSVERTRELEQAMVTAAEDVLAAHGGPKISKGIFSQVGSSMQQRGMSFGSSTGGHIVQVQLSLVPIDERSVHADQIAREWRAKLATFPGIDTMEVTYTTGFSGGKAIEVQLSHPDPDKLREAARELATQLGTFQGVKDIDDGYPDGKQQLDLRILPEGKAAGLNAFTVAGAVRAAFFGAEALRLQRGRDEVRVYVRLPEDERTTEQTFEDLIIRTPSGAEMPLSAIAEVNRGESYVEIKRIDGRRAVSVTADIDQAQGNANEVVAKLKTDVLRTLKAHYPQLTWSMGGEQKEQAETMKSLAMGMLAALLVMYALIAVVFRSYIQPIIIMFVIPFGLVGAVVGHLVLGFSLSLMSMMGIVALAGVAVNDSIVFIDAINRLREQGMTAREAAVAAGQIRFRPIFLTSSTTFVGLAPLILEKSMQARFLVPMAVSLGFGILLSVMVSLLVVPCFYLAVEDVRNGVRRAWRFIWGPSTAV